MSILTYNCSFWVNGQRLLEMYSCRGLSVFACRRLIQLCKISKMNVTHLVLPVGDRGDESYPPDSGLHVLLQRHHQRQGQRRAQDLLCAHRDDPLTVPRECNAVRLVHSMLILHRHKAQTFISDWWRRSHLLSAVVAKRNCGGTKETDLRQEEKTLDFNFALQDNLCHSCSIHLSLM